MSVFERIEHLMEKAGYSKPVQGEQLHTYLEKIANCLEGLLDRLEEGAEMGLSNFTGFPPVYLEPGTVVKNVWLDFEKNRIRVEKVGHRFSYVKYTEKSAQNQQILKNLFENLEDVIGGILHDGRAKSLCLTKLEESFMWCGKSIRDQQILEEGFDGEQVERSAE